MQKPKSIFVLPVEMEPEPCMSVERELEFVNDSKHCDNTRQSEIDGKLTAHFGCLTAGS